MISQQLVQLQVRIDERSHTTKTYNCTLPDSPILYTRVLGRGVYRPVVMPDDLTRRIFRLHF